MALLVVLSDYNDPIADSEFEILVSSVVNLDLSELISLVLFPILVILVYINASSAVNRESLLVL